MCIYRVYQKVRSILMDLIWNKNSLFQNSSSFPSYATITRICPHGYFVAKCMIIWTSTLICLESSSSARSVRYHQNPVQELKPDDHSARRTYCRWLLQMTGDQPDFLNHVLWTDESGFTRDGIMNLQNLHIYSDENPRVTHSTPFQPRFHVNVWTGVLGNTLIVPFIIEDNER